MTKPKKLTGTKSAKSHTTKKKKAKPGKSANSSIPLSNSGPSGTTNDETELTDANYSGFAEGAQYFNVTGVKIPKTRQDRKALTFGPGRAVFQPQYGVQISTNGPRPLNPRELAILTTVFGSELDYKIIKVWENSPSPYTCLETSRGIRNTIHIYYDINQKKAEEKRKKNDDDINLNAINENLLIHEAAHIWQFQKRMSYTYIAKALVQHTFKSLDDVYLAAEEKVTKQKRTRKAYNPYEFEYFIRYKIPWDLWGPESQAQWIEDKKKLPGSDLLYPYGFRNLGDYLKYISDKPYLKVPYTKYP